MLQNYLVGPVRPELARESWPGPCAAGVCRTFNAAGTVDLCLTPGMTWAEMVAQWPPGWQPDALFLTLAYQEIPPALWTAPVPLIGLACDWNLLWHEYRRILPFCDCVFTDSPGAARLRQAGYAQVEAAYLYGYGETFTPAVPPSIFRELDVVFVGNLHPDVQAARLPWLGRLAALSERYRVRVATGIFGADYRRLLARARLVFNRSVRGEANQRAAEAVAAGALLLQEAENTELPHYLEPGRDYVTYTSATLEQVLDYWLTHETERQAVVAAAQAKLPALSFAAQWQHLVQRVREQWPHLQARAAARASLGQGPAVAPAWVETSTAATVGDQPVQASAVVAALQARVAQGWAEGTPAWPTTAYPPRFDRFRLAWEEAAWHHPDQPEQEQAVKNQLTAWQAWWQLGQQTGQAPYYYEALRRRPQCAATQRDLGRALAQAGQAWLAWPHLEAAITAFPFDADLARTLAHVLRAVEAPTSWQALQTARRRLARAAPGLIAWEPWFQPATPTGQELVTVLIPCCNRWALTRACLDSLWRWTRSPWELVVVDNGSTDATAAGLAELARRPGPVRVQLLRNPTNVGYAAACNQALAQAQGRFWVLLNNDTEVTPQWLERLLACLLSQWPRLGLVGPVTDYAPPPQVVAGPGPEDTDLPAFAQRHQAAYHGQALQVPRLSGFCLLGPDEVFRQVGPLDERFHLGFFEDDDYGLRVREAGYGLAVVRDVFVRHHGSQTFAALNVDTEALLRENYARFAAKWGPEKAAGYRPWSPPPAAVPSPPPAEPTAARAAGVTLTMIVRNEEAHLAACLAPVRDLVDQLVVVDTGSTDRTREIARECGAEVHDFPWVDSFAAARNEALRHARHAWCFWLDADDRVDEANRQELQQLFATLPDLPREAVGFAMKCLCVARGDSAATVVDHVRLFRWHPQVRWEYRVHEQILPSLRRLEGQVRFAPVVIHHLGYQDAAVRRCKLDRDLRLLRLEDAERPDDPFTLFNLGAVFLELGHPAEALGYLDRSLAQSQPQDSIVRKLYALKCQAWRALGRSPEALAACREGRRWYADDVELLFQEGLVRRELGDLVGARGCLEELLRTQPGEHFASVDTSLTGYKAWHNLAVVCQELGGVDDAIAAWRRTVALRPEFTPGWVGLAELFLEQQRWEELEEVLQAWEKLPQADGEAQRQRVAALLVRREFAAARALLAARIAQEPEALWPRVLLSHAYLQEGADWPAAERALRDVLRLDPDHAEAQRNLAVLLRMQPPPR